MSKPLDEQPLEEYLKSLGIAMAPDDSPIYRDLPSITIVPQQEAQDEDQQPQARDRR
jgi:hypothetical protein